MAVVTVWENGKTKSTSLGVVEVVKFVLRAFKSPAYTQVTLGTRRQSTLTFEATTKHRYFHGKIERTPEDHSYKKDVFTRFSEARLSWLDRPEITGIPKPSVRELAHEYLAIAAGFDPASNLIRQGTLSTAQCAEIICSVMVEEHPPNVYTAICAVRSRR